MYNYESLRMKYLRSQQAWLPLNNDLNKLIALLSLSSKKPVSTLLVGAMSLF